MDTKWRRFSTSIVTKVFAFLLGVASITTAVLQIPLGNRENISSECVWVDDYIKSDAYHTELLQALKQVEKIRFFHKHIDNAEYFYYFIDGNLVYSNANCSLKDFSGMYQGASYFMKDAKWIDELSGEDITSVTGYYKKDLEAYVTFTDVYLNQKQQIWLRDKNKMLFHIIIGCCFALLGILMLIYLMCITGKKHMDEKVHLSIFDKLYSDINIILLGFIISFFYCNIGEIFQDDKRIALSFSEHGMKFLTDFQEKTFLSALFFSAAIALFSIIIFTLFLSLIRKVKAGRLISHSLLYIILQNLYKVNTISFQYIFYKKIFPEASMTDKLYCRQLIMIILTIILFLMAVIFSMVRPTLAAIALLLEILVIIWYVKGNRTLFTNIDQGIQENIKEQMKAERMKVALITNVSHDLKTPLTSIISYTDLLAREEGLSEAAFDYIKILQTKSERLKNMVTDLFDLAKSTSGDITLEFDTIDLKKLLEQTLAEMGDKIKQSGLEFRVKLPDTSVNIMSDGKRLYRVLQNVIDNALKYSLKDTRVYIYLDIVGNKAIITMKNVAGYQMDFTSEEILQRFYRGDASRAEEGSGLGLSIAQGFTGNCGGEFKVEIDGDIFKVLISFELLK